MGGMYNVVFDENPHADHILHALNLNRADFGRFRDALVAMGEIVVYTRCGGANRQSYERVFEAMRAHPLFLNEKNDTFDSTYCTFFFSVPEAWSEQMKAWDVGVAWDADTRWTANLANFKNGKVDLHSVLERMNKYMTVQQPGGGKAMGAGDFLKSLSEKK